MTARATALVGCGQWGRNIARCLAGMGALAVICDTDAARGGATAADLGVEFVPGLGGVLERSDITAVVTATPAATHADLAGRALDAGKHVLVEKPIALSVRDAEAIASKAKARGLTLMTGHLLQYHPVFVRLLAMVGDGSLGRIGYIYSNRLNQGRLRTEENALWSLAPHDISMILALAGTSPRRVTAMGQDVVQPGIPDMATAALEFDDGLKAHLFCSWLNPYKEHRLAVIGDKAMAVFEDSAARWEDKLMLLPHQVIWNGRTPEFVKAAGQAIAVAKGEPLTAELLHFLACVARQAVCRTGPDEAIAVLKVLAAAQKSMESKMPVEL